MIDSHSQARLAENWQAVQQDVLSATTAANRPVDSVTIIGVTKYVDAETTLALVDAGCRILGENRPQVLWKKNEEVDFPDDVRWHLIGHLQRNKLRRSLPYRPMIHSVDSERLLTAIVEEAAGQQIPTKLLLEVNISGEEAKTGLMPQDLRPILESHLDSKHTDTGTGVVEIVGLMAMAGWGTDVAAARHQFAATRQLRDELQQQTGAALPELSMGMSGDFPAAIAEGATMVRIGSRLFEGLLP
ncbi:putative pyridoxal phosphate-dependent enzyme [Rhodopirellula maiorica SM1]|uniref:Pyridoxal phosphate homeostasis protein n=1 Tax=Rhodopirellula maiorica SM1 TaxID=1265738 RepID=M5RKC2_9BACT|nr:YggS family pyridoxal phosphate-dependent enzyme [Rhodopirellula maiorica]EMI19760.1 putative pyridoxal phosphate-dependent enzyme [Rhodopirellula maiorica SM1]